MTSRPKDSVEFRKEFLWPLYKRARQPLADHQDFEADEGSLLVACLWCLLGDALSLRCSASISNIGNPDSLYHPLLQGAEELDWLLCLQPNS